MSRGRKLFFLLLTVIPLIGCTTKAPTIAHTHIGHAITGWIETPGQTGLLITAEQEGATVAANTRQAAAAANLDATRRAVTEALHALDPSSAPGGTAGLGFGLLPAVRETLSHMAFAAESDDASVNVRTSVPEINKKANSIVSRCNELEVLGRAALASRSAKEAKLLAREMDKLAAGIVDDGTGVTYGLAHLRTDIEAMIDREDPRYTTVDTWYLLNLVRLPSGKWIFQQRDPGSTSGYGFPQ